MAYDDRDYFQSKPKFEFSSGLHAGTKGLMIAIIAGFIAALVISDSLEYAGAEFWTNVATGNEKAQLGYDLFVLVPWNVIPIRDAFQPGYWKLLTHWLVAPGLITAIIDVIFIYMLGRMLEQLFGTKRYLALFIGACVLSGLLSALVDGWIVGDKISVIMGPSGGLIACLMAPVWIAPHQKSILGWPLRNVTLGLVAIFSAFALLMGVFGKGPAVNSPTQLIWGAAIGAGYMLWLKKRGRVPSVAGGVQNEENLQPWEKPGYLNDYSEKPFDEREFLATASKQRDEEEKAIKQRAGDKEKLDKLLEKISASGIDSLTRKERKFLDEQSKKK
ncbi:MAG: rhomboid family intramembrane serine protease [Planctomycetes bacterium]|nr:rhomboid family intramembrane serine protease [Planctomycetota bacterium]